MATVIKRKLEGEVEVHEGAADLYHDMFKSRPHHVANVSPHFVQSCELHHGDHGTPGNIIIWKYTLGGKPLVAKNIIEAIHEENKLVRQSVMEGDLLKDYKYFVGTCQVIPKDKETSIAKWSLEYEKLHAGVPEPTELLDALLGVAKDTEVHHLNQNE